MPSGPHSSPFALQVWLALHISFTPHIISIPCCCQLIDLTANIAAHLSLSTFDSIHICKCNLHTHSPFCHKFGSGFAALPPTIAPYARFISLKGCLSIPYHPFQPLPLCHLLKVWESNMMNSIMNWERVNVQFQDSSGGLRDTMDAMGERERCGESNSSQKVWHAIVALREIADKGLRTS